MFLQPGDLGLECRHQDSYGIELENLALEIRAAFQLDRAYYERVYDAWMKCSKKSTLWVLLCGIVCVLMGGILVLFLKDLFLGLLSIGCGLYFGFTSLTSKSRWVGKRLREFPEPNLPMIITFLDSSFITKSKYGGSDVSYELIKNVFDMPFGIYIRLPNNHSFLVPRESVESPRIYSELASRLEFAVQNQFEK